VGGKHRTETRAIVRVRRLRSYVMSVGRSGRRWAAE
jgi:hypothetical protein